MFSGIYNIYANSQRDCVQILMSENKNISLVPYYSEFSGISEKIYSLQNWIVLEVIRGMKFYD